VGLPSSQGDVCDQDRASAGGRKGEELKKTIEKGPCFERRKKK